uniref:Potassium channel domain-containing protein n=1 Tax=Esox lucius TaxID=8010 RepID=A0A3P8YEF6_ESOLU
ALVGGEQCNSLRPWPWFGMTTPATNGGKIFLVFYGCAATILFFNLFLERVITLVLKSCHERRHLHKAVLLQNGGWRFSEAGGGGNRGKGLAAWYCVMLILSAAAILVSCCASALYSAVEGWGYLDSLNYCFVAFSTIGFGDMVSSQRLAYSEGNENQMESAVSTSFFNVISIVNKQVLNWLLRSLEHPCCCPGPVAHHPHHRQPRRNVVVPGHLRVRRDLSIETDMVNESEAEGWRMSGEMISMRNFLAANKVGLRAKEGSVFVLGLLCGRAGSPVDLFLCTVDAPGSAVLTTVELWSCQLGLCSQFWKSLSHDETVAG